MSTSFLFIQSLTDEGCHCLRLAKDGSIEAPLAYRGFTDIKLMQHNANTIVVLSAQWAGLYKVELPWLPERKARAAIPFALEEQLAQKINLLHFAFDKRHHRDNHYLVAIMEKSWLADVMNFLQEHKIEFTEITLDWFALQEGEVCLTSSTVLVNDEQYQGALTGQLARDFLSVATSAHIFQFTDTGIEWQKDSNQLIDQSFFTWVAQRLSKLPRLNLCQGEFLHQHHGQRLSRNWVNICILLAGIWIVSLFGIKILNLIRLNHQLAQLDQKIAVVYREFFPNAPQVISPRFRIGQLLKGTETGQASVLWPLLDHLESAFNPTQFTIEQLQYRHSALTVNVKGNDFAALEAFKQRLKQANIKVNQTQASSHEGQVNASLELKL